MPVGSQLCCSAASDCMGRHKACVSWTTLSCCCGSCLLIRSGHAMLLRWRSSVRPRVLWCYLRRDRFRISLDILRSVGWTRVSGLGHSSFYTHDECSFGRLFVGRLRTSHSIRLWRGCSPRLHRADMHAYCSQFAFFRLNRRRKDTVCTVITALTCNTIFDIGSVILVTSHYCCSTRQFGW